MLAWINIANTGVHIDEAMRQTPEQQGANAAWAPPVERRRRTERGL